MNATNNAQPIILRGLISTAGKKIVVTVIKITMINKKNQNNY